MLDYKSIIIKRYALGLSYKELAEEFSASKSGINDFIRAFERCEKLSYPLPEGITNYAIYELVYGHEPGRRLIVGDPSGRIIVNKAMDFLLRQNLSVPLMFNTVYRPHANHLNSFRKLDPNSNPVNPKLSIIVMPKSA